jgi:hypothetical protein
MNLQIIDPTNYAGWDDVLLSTPGHSFFHSSAWARVLKDSYGYTPMYFASIKNGQFSALIPVMEVNSFITGKRGVSLPFTDYCEPLLNENIEFVDLFNYIIEFGKKHGWKYLELRGGDKYLRNQESEVRRQEAGGSNLNPDPCILDPGRLPNTLYPTPCTDSFPLAPFPSKKYFGHTLDLTGGEEKILSSLRDSTKRNIKKAIKEGVTVKILNSLESVKEFYRLNCMTRKDHGLPPQPYYFFKKIYEHIVSHNKGFVSLASYQDRNIAGAIFFYFGENALFKYGASDKKYQNLRANNLAIWEGIKWYSQNGYKRFCFGRTEPDDQGLIQFKSGWAADQQQINYYQYNFKDEEFIQGQGKVKELGAKILKKMPIPLLRTIASVFYKHAG